MNVLRRIRNFFKKENCDHLSIWSGWEDKGNYSIYITKCTLCGKILRSKSRFGVEKND